MFGFGLQMNWLGKHTLFRFPVAGLLKWMGGEPINRSATKGFVEEAIERFRQRPHWVLGISPEGTRKRAGTWKTGFHRIALGAGVPIVPVTIDYSRKVLALHPPFFPTPDFRADERILRQNFHKAMARFPENYAENPEDS